MGIGIVLIFWAVVGIVLASGSALALVTGAWFFTSKGARGRKLFIIAAGIFPFVCLAWGGAVFVGQALVNDLLLQRDVGLGDSWYAPLPNGYSIFMIDETDDGYLQITQTPFNSVTTFAEQFGDISDVQISGRYIIGKKTAQNPGYLLLDTENRRAQDFANETALLERTKSLGIVQLQLEPIYQVYLRYRFTWFDGLAAALFFGVPLIGFFFLCWWGWRVRKAAILAPA